MKLYIIRHAQSNNNANWLKTGSNKYRDSDPDLTDIGKQQVDHLAKYLRDLEIDDTALGRDPHNLTGYRITHVYCSLMVRSIETGLGIAHALDLPLVALRDLHETGGIVSGNGMDEPYEGLPGKPRSYFTEHYPDLVITEPFGEEGWWNRPFEEEEERIERANRVIDFLLTRHSGTEDRAAIVTHGAFYNHIMRRLIGLPDRRAWFAMSNTGITSWDFHKDHWENAELLPIIDYTNRVEHLPRHLITP